MTDLPVYFVVGEHGGINSGSEVGPLHTLENGAATPERSNLSELLAHEVTHIQQFSAVGLPRCGYIESAATIARTCGRH